MMAAIESLERALEDRERSIRHFEDAETKAKKEVDAATRKLNDAAGGRAEQTAEADEIRAALAKLQEAEQYPLAVIGRRYAVEQYVKENELGREGVAWVGIPGDQALRGRRVRGAVWVGEPGAFTDEERQRIENALTPAIVSS